MLSRQSERIRKCLEAAEEAKAKAAVEVDPVRKQEFLKSEKRWRKVAKGFESVERVDNFLAAYKKHAHKHPVCQNCQVSMWMTRTRDLPDGTQMQYFACLACGAKSKILALA
jgi:hypothetical protein